MANFTESVVEEAALAWLESLGYAVKHGPEIAPNEFLAERAAPVAQNATTQLRSKFGEGNRFRIGNSSTFGLLMQMKCENGLVTTEDNSAVKPLSHARGSLDLI